MHSRSTRFSNFLCLLFLGVANAYGAAECGNLLVPDFAFLQRDVAIDLSYISIISAADFPLHKKNAETDLDSDTNPGIFQTSAHVGLDLPIARELLQSSSSFAEFQQKAQQKYREYGFKYPGADLAKYYTQSLPQQRATLYGQCMHATGSQVRIGKADQNLVELNVGPGARQEGVAAAVIAKVTVSGGVYAGAGEIALKAGQENTLFFVRDLGKDFHFAANAGGVPIAVFVPRYIGAMTDVVSSDAQCASAAKVARATHLQVLEQDADSATVNREAALLDGGLNNVRQLVEKLLLGSEFAQKSVTGQTAESVLTSLYHRILARDADAAGLAYNTNVLNKLGLQKTVVAFAESGEYTHRFGDWVVPGTTARIKYCGKK